MRRFAILTGMALRLTLRDGVGSAMSLGFFVIVATLVPLAVGPGPDLLVRLAPAIVWIAAVLAGLLSLDRLFAEDMADGTLDLLALAPPPLTLTVLAKLAAHWISTAVPVIALSPVIALALGLEGPALAVLAASLLLGTPILSLIGAVAAALVLGARRGAVLAALLVLPLSVPVLIFGVGAVDAATMGLAARPHLFLLGACLALALPLAPLAITAALRQALD